MTPAFPFREAAQAWIPRDSADRAQRAAADLAWDKMHLIWAADAVFPPGCDVRSEGPISLAKAVWFLRNDTGLGCWVRAEGLLLEVWVEGADDDYQGVLRLRRNRFAAHPGEAPAEWYVADFSGPDIFRAALGILAQQLPLPANWRHGVTP